MWARGHVEGRVGIAHHEGRGGGGGIRTLSIGITHTTAGWAGGGAGAGALHIEDGGRFGSHFKAHPSSPMRSAVI